VGSRTTPGISSGSPDGDDESVRSSQNVTLGPDFENVMTARRPLERGAACLSSQP
jgi:hypothetical protein